MSPQIGRLFDEYEAYHRTPGNKSCHAVGIPLIVFSLLALLTQVRLVELAGFTVTAAEALIAAVGIYYVMLDARLGIAMIALCAGFAALGRLTPWPLALGLFVLGWVLQFVGHFRYEKRSPAFFTNLKHLLVGPMWVLASALSLAADKKRVLLVVALAGAALPAAAVPRVATAAEVRQKIGTGDAPVVVNFWATWCVPCVVELPELAELERRYAGRVRFLGVSLDAWVPGQESQQNAKVDRMLAAKKVAYPNVLFTGGQDDLLGGFSLDGALPETVVYRAGKEVFRVVGRIDAKNLDRRLAAIAGPVHRTKNQSQKEKSK